MSFKESVVEAHGDAVDVDTCYLPLIMTHFKVIFCNDHDESGE
jgi:hypothetical protein